MKDKAQNFYMLKMHEQSGFVQIMRKLACNALSFCLFLSVIYTFPPQDAFAQSADFYNPQFLRSEIAETTKPKNNFLEADIVNRDAVANTVTAMGNVRIRYNNKIVQADEVTFFAETGRILAEGHVRIYEEDGTVITSDQADLTSRYSQTSAQEIFAVINDKRYVWARDFQKTGQTSTFEDVTYTTCKPCEDDPEKAPIWRVKADKVVNDEEAKVTRFYGNRFELFGQPILHLPYFAAPSEKAKRKSGFLSPSITGEDELGSGLSIPYYFALDPSYDLTLTPTIYTRPAILLASEWRHKLNNGAYEIKLYGAFQDDVNSFNNKIDRQEMRYAAETRGAFQISKNWNFGWDGKYTSDEGFTDKYELGFDDILINKVWLEGQTERSYAKIGLTDYLSNDVDELDRHLPSALPQFEYVKSLLNAQDDQQDLLLKVNAHHLSRKETYFRNRPEKTCLPWAIDQADCAVNGLAGDITQLSSSLEWRRNAIIANGLSATSFAYLKADYTTFSLDSETATPFYDDTNDSLFRAMPAAGLDLRYPLISNTISGDHILTPILQVIARPDEMHAGKIPNETSQSLILDSTNLFSWDKFAGNDRHEGGIRANYGITYDGRLSEKTSIGFTIGQSYHLAGENPYKAYDASFLTYNNGLRDDMSDIVIGTNLNHAFGNWGKLTSVNFDWNNDFLIDKDDGSLTSWRSKAQLNSNYLSMDIAYALEPKNDELSLDRQETVSGGVGIRFAEGWSAGLRARYDIKEDRYTARSAYLSYGDECTIFNASYSQGFDGLGEISSHNYMFNLELKSLLSYDYTSTVKLDE